MSRKPDLRNAGFPIGEDGKPLCHLDYVGRGCYGLFTDASCTGEPVVKARTVLKLMDYLIADDCMVVLAPFVEIMWSLEFSHWSEVWVEDVLGTSLFESPHPSDDDPDPREEGDLCLETAWSRRRGLWSV